MAVISYPFWLIFAIFSPILVLLFVLGAGFYLQPKIENKPAIIEKYPS